MCYQYLNQITMFKISRLSAYSTVCSKQNKLSKNIVANCRKPNRVNKPVNVYNATSKLVGGYKIGNNMYNVYEVYTANKKTNLKNNAVNSVHKKNTNLKNNVISKVNTNLKNHANSKVNTVTDIYVVVSVDNVHYTVVNMHKSIIDDANSIPHL